MSRPIDRHARLLHPAENLRATRDAPSVGEILRSYRLRSCMTQAELAALLNTSQSRLSKIESGAHVVRDVKELRLIAARLGLSAERLGVLPDAGGSSGSETMLERAKQSQQDWIDTRQAFAGNRLALSELASSTHPDIQRVEGTAVLSRNEWMPSRPVPLDRVALRWLADSPEAALSGTSMLTEHVRPLTALDRRYTRYSRALRDLVRPKLLVNRPCYRFLGAHWDGASGRLDFGGFAHYFDVIDVHEAVGHEYAAAWLAAGRRVPRQSDLPLRSAIADVFDLSARPMFTSINTLTIRRGARGDHRFYLHSRDAQSVASAGGIYHVMPAGVFQPSASAAQLNGDFSIWRTMQREFSEELLGNAEHDGYDGVGVDYNTEPFRTMDTFREQGRMVVHALGTVLDPLTLWAEQLTVAVIDGDAFDLLFGGLVAVNDEGTTLTTASGSPAAGIPFTAEVRERLVDEPLSPISRACIELAWRHRRELLG